MPKHDAGPKQAGHTTKRHRGEMVEETLQKQARLIDLAPAAAIVRDMDGTIMFWSRGAEALYGWTKEDALGRRTDDLLRTDFPEPLENIVATLLQGGTWSGELRHVAKDGRTVIVESHWRGQMTADGKIEEILESNADITERKRLQEHLEELVRERTARLQESNAELEAFSYSLSHDMRAPLRAILSFTQFAIEDCGAELSPTAKDYLEKVSKAARRLDRLIRDVLSLSRLSHEQVELGTVDLERLIRDIIDERPELQEPAADVRVEGQIPPVRGHEVFLTQALANLLGNAVKFVASGVKPRVRLRAQTAGERVRLWVEDNGIGIDPQAHEKVFELFGRNQRASAYEGTGVGLAIVRKATERMGGQAGVESEVGKGSRFWIELQAAK